MFILRLHGCWGDLPCFRVPVLPPVVIPPRDSLSLATDILCVAPCRPTIRAGFAPRQGLTGQPAGLQSGTDGGFAPPSLTGRVRRGCAHSRLWRPRGCHTENQFSTSSGASRMIPGLDRVSRLLGIYCRAPHTIARTRRHQFKYNKRLTTIPKHPSNKTSRDYSKWSPPAQNPSSPMICRS